MPFADNNGVAIHYQRTGTPGASPILLIQGFSLPGALYSDMAEKLADEFEVIWFDNRGTGISDAPEEGYDIETMAGDAFAVMDAAGWESAHILGASMGGMIAQEMALAMPSRVRSLALIATYAGGVTRSEEETAEVAARVSVMHEQAKLQSSDPERAARMLWEVVGQNSSAEEENIIREIANLMKQMPARRVPDLFSLATFHTLDRLHLLDIPVHIRHGSNDKVFPVEAAFAMAQQLKHCELHIIYPGAHAINAVLGQRSTSILKDWWLSLEV